jgi:hypothetical protein
MRKNRLVLFAGGFTIFAAFFVATLLAIDYFAPDFNGPNTRNQIRATHATAIKNALDAYRRARGTYPILYNNEVDDLRPPLVDGGYLTAIPVDPLRPAKGQQYRYATIDGSVFALLFNIEKSDRTITPCLFGNRSHNFWSNPAACPF